MGTRAGLGAPAPSPPRRLQEELSCSGFAAEGLGVWGPEPRGFSSHGLRDSRDVPWGCELWPLGEKSAPAGRGRRALR